MPVYRHSLANANWNVESDTHPGNARSVEHAIIACLMDIREELREVRMRLNCHETLAIPRILRRIEANTTKPKRRKARVLRKTA